MFFHYQTTTTKPDLEIIAYFITLKSTNNAATSTCYINSWQTRGFGSGVITKKKLTFSTINVMTAISHRYYGLISRLLRQLSGAQRCKAHRCIEKSVIFLNVPWALQPPPERLKLRLDGASTFRNKPRMYCESGIQPTGDFTNEFGKHYC